MRYGPDLPPQALAKKDKQTGSKRTALRSIWNETGNKGKRG